MLFNLRNEVDKQSFLNYCNKLIKEGGVVELNKKRLQRSLSQNKYLHICLGYFASEFGYSLDEVKLDIFKKLCNHEIFLQEKTNKHGNKVYYLRSTADLDTKELTLAIERFRTYSSSVCGLYIPEPNEQEALIEVQKQIDSFSSFL